MSSTSRGIRLFGRRPAPRPVVAAVALVVAASLLVVLPALMRGSRATAVEPPPGRLVPSVDGFGWTTGTFSVGDDGSAQYVLPLWMPAGRGGVFPRLALSYGSGRGNGPFGVGWMLQGLSTVRPCPRTLAQDGMVGGVRFDASDVYCLDGARLVPVGAHTGSQQEFRTEREMFARIIGFGARNSVPTHFRVWTRDGQVLTFGGSPASQLRAYQLAAGPDRNPPTLEPSDSPVTVNWSLDLIEDRNGNSATIEYDKSSLGDENNLWAVQMRPRAIAYGPNRRVVFGYGGRDDPIDAFTGGVHVRLPSLVTSITMEGGQQDGERQVLRRYALDYSDDDSITGRSLLSRVTECDGDGACLRPVEFGWSPGSLQFDTSDTPVTGTGIQHAVGDADGDGRDDLFYLKSDCSGQSCSQWTMRRASGSGADTFGSERLSGLPRAPQDFYDRPVAPSELRPVDVNRDNRLDAMALLFANSRSEFKLYTSDGDGYVAAADLTPGHDSAIDTDVPYFADLDGDGATDFVMPFSQLPAGDGTPPMVRLHMARGNGSGFADVADTGLITPRSFPAAIKALDHDGDGRTSLLLHDDFADPNRLLLFGLDAAGEPTLRPGGEVGLNLPSPGLFGDVNGDGLADSIGADLDVQLNTGRGFSPVIQGPAGVPVAAKGGRRIVDFDHDGRADVLLIRPGDPADAGDTASGVQMYSWRSGGFVRVPLNGTAGLGGGVFHRRPSPGPGEPPVEVGMTTTQLLDIDADGMLDLTRLAPADAGPGEPLHVQVVKRRGEVPDMITTVREGGVPRTLVRYTTMADRSVYQPGSCAYPLYCPVNGGLLVADHSLLINTTADPWDTYRHRYEEARVDLHGRGWLGFVKHTVTRARSGATTVTEFDNTTRDAATRTYPLAGLPDVTTYTISDAASGRDYRHVVDNDYELRRIGARYTVELERTVESESERASGASGFTMLRHRTTTRAYDDFGNPDLVTTTTQGGRTQSVDPTYANDTAAWLIGLMKRERTTGCTATNTCLTREKMFDHDDRGNRNLEVVEPDRSELRLTTVTRYGVFGTVERVTTTADAMPARTTTFEYNNNDKLHPTDVINASGHRVTVQTDPGLGVPTRRAGPNPGQITTMRYDHFGRPRGISWSDGGSETITHEVIATGRQVITDTAGGGRTIVAYDALDRPVRQQVRTFDGRMATTTTGYDPRGRVSSVSRPTLPGQSAHNTITAYDNRDRPVRITEPDGAVTRHEYAGLETHTYDARNVHSYLVATVDGDIGSSFEDDPSSAAWLHTGFEYRPFGELARVTAADDTVTTMEYDLLGRRERLVDPSSGITTNTYNNFGEVETETNALNQVTTYTYDNLGRVLTIASPDDGTATNTWDIAPDGVGSLANARSADGVSIDYTYDDIGRPATKQWTIEGTAYQFGFGYDAIGRASTTQYPALPGAASAGRLTIVNTYNEHGYLKSVADAGPGGQPYWTADTRNEAGQLTGETLRNGVVTTHRYQPETGLHTGTTVTGPTGVGTLAEINYEYDPNRNVDVRHDVTNQRYERYGYDELNRLERWAATRGPDLGLPTIIDANYRYDSVGNLTREVTFRDQQREPDIVYGYSDDARPHALTSRNGITFAYDAAGRQISGDRRTVRYNRSNLPTVLTWGQGKTTTFRYDPENSRVLKRDAERTDITLGAFERRLHTTLGDTQVENIHNITVEGRLVAQIERNQATPTSPVDQPQIRFIHTDRQGSSVKVTNATGRPTNGDTFLVNMFYDPFGRRIDANYKPVALQRHADPRWGYTNHYHDDEYDLINMKGRIYSPVDRRFLTPDPIVQDPFSSRSYNRYAYAWNNPATRIDPTGLSTCDLYGYLPECDVRPTEYPGPEQGNTDITDPVFDPWTNPNSGGTVDDDHTSKSAKPVTSQRVIFAGDGLHQSNDTKEGDLSSGDVVDVLCGLFEPLCVADENSSPQSPPASETTTASPQKNVPGARGRSALECWDICKLKKLAVGSIRREIELAQAERDRRYTDVIDAWKSAEENFDELEDAYGDFPNQLAEAFKMMAVLPMIGNAIEIFNGYGKLAGVNNMVDRFEVLNGQLEDLRTRLRAAEQAYENCRTACRQTPPGTLLP
jgi:RHS repeat-associated protein